MLQLDGKEKVNHRSVCVTQLKQGFLLSRISGTHKDSWNNSPEDYCIAADITEDGLQCVCVI